MAEKFDDKKKIGEIKVELETTETVVTPQVDIEILEENSKSNSSIMYGVESESTESDVVGVAEEATSGTPIRYDSNSVPSEDYVADGGNSSLGENNVSNGSSVPVDGDGVSSPQNTDDYVNNGYNPNGADAADSVPSGDSLESPNKSGENNDGNDENPANVEGNNPSDPDKKTQLTEGENSADDTKNINKTGQPGVNDPKNDEENGEGGLPKKDGLDEKSDAKDSQNPDAKGLDKDKKNNDDPDNPNAQGQKVPQKPQDPTKPTNAAGTDVANRNLEHNKRMQAGKKSEDEGSKKKSQDSNIDKKTEKGEEKKSDPKDKKKKKNGDSKAKVKGKTKNKIGKALDIGNKIKHPFRSTFDFLKNKVWLWLLAHPPVLIGILIAFLLALLIIGMFIEGGSGNSNGQSGTRCNYELNGVLSTGTLSASGLKVELVNCQATESNYTVLETVELEKYVLGVALAEIGPSASPEALKAQIVAARNFTLTRNSGMCPGNPDNCFYGYNANSGKIRMRACENDQVYWDYEKNIYRQDQGAVSLYSPEINSGTLWKSALSADKKAEILKIAEDVKGVVLLDENGNVVKTPYNSTVSTAFNTLADEGKTYQEILSAQYGVNNYNDASCSYDGELFYGDYVLTSDGASILTQRLDMFLNNNGSSIEALGAQIAENVNTAGYGTRAGVVAAAVTLIGELGNNYGVKVPYYWGGGHYDGVVVGPLGYWGSTECHTYANNQHYNYCGFDCSGFVPWAIKNGGFNMAQKLAGDFKNIAGSEKVSLKGNYAVLQPGDLLESSGHIVLVIGVDEDMKQYICAEAAGNQYGVLFTRRSFNESGYWGVRMDGFYNNPSNIRSA